MNKVYLTGDKHGRFDDLAANIEMFGIDKDDYVVIMGDSGLNYFSGKRANAYKKKLNDIGPKFLIVRGNHEARPNGVEEFYGDDVISGCFMRDRNEHGDIMFENIFYMLDGGVYTIAGKSVLVIGGAYSVDKFYRLVRTEEGLDGYYWFPDEQLDDNELSEIMETAKELKQVDYIFTHTCPLSYEPTDLFLPGIDQSTVDQTTEEFLEDIHNVLTYDKWYCGHWHTDRIVDDIRFLYHNIIKLGEMY